MTEFDIRREDGATGGRWVTVVNGHEAQAVYSRVNPELIIIEHTESPEALKGRGVGRALIAQAVADARAEGFKIIPLCPFAKALFDKTPEWADVRAGA